MIQALDIVRDPLQRFYVLLTDEQRERFNAMGTSGGAQAPAGGSVVALCSEQSNDVTKLPVQRIEEVLQPSGPQRDAFEALKQVAQVSGDLASHPWLPRSQGWPIQALISLS